MTNDGKIEIATIKPMFGMGPATFEINSTNALRVLVRRDSRGWNACSSIREVFDGGAHVASADTDLLEAAKKALALAAVSSKLLELEEERRAARSRAADSWKHLIERGASGKGTIGTESTGETFVIELAGTLLPCGMPALELFHRFSWYEIEAIHDAVQSLGPDGWYWPLRAKQNDVTGKARRPATAKKR